MDNDVNDMYKKEILLFVTRYALVTVIIALIVGVVYREYSKSMLHDMSLDKIILASYYLSLLHSQIIVVCVVIPMVLLVITYLVAKTGLENPDYSSLKRR